MCGLQARHTTLTRAVWIMPSGSSNTCTRAVCTIRGVGEGGQGGRSPPPTFESWELRKYQLNTINKTSSSWRSSGIG